MSFLSPYEDDTLATIDNIETAYGFFALPITNIILMLLRHLIITRRKNYASYIFTRICICIYEECSKNVIQNTT